MEYMYGSLGVSPVGDSSTYVRGLGLGTGFSGDFSSSLSGFCSGPLAVGAKES